MRTISKILLTIVLLIVAAFLSQLVRMGLDTNSSTGGIGPFIIYPAALAAIFAVWKYKPKQNDGSDDFTLRKN